MGYTPPPVNKLPKPDDPARTCRIKGEDGVVYEGYLPNIAAVEPPNTTTKSALIRWYHDVGFSASEIYNYLGVKYQMVRNIVTNVPKRAAREDTPDLVITLRQENELLEDMLDGALDASLKKGRVERLATEKQDRRELKQAIYRHSNGDEDTEIDEEEVDD